MLQQRPNTFAQTILSLSFFACDEAADHTFRFARPTSGGSPYIRTVVRGANRTPSRRGRKHDEIVSERGHSGSRTAHGCEVRLTVYSRLESWSIY